MHGHMVMSIPPSLPANPLNPSLAPQDEVFVHLQGVVQPSNFTSSSTVIFQLPYGYRPSATNIFVATTSPSSRDEAYHVLVRVDPTGDVKVSDGNDTVGWWNEMGWVARVDPVAYGVWVWIGQVS